MNIAHVVGNRYGWKSNSHHRMLNSEPTTGTIASGYIRKQPGSSLSRHTFNTKEYHGVLVLSGQGIYTDDKREVPLSAGDFIQRKPGIAHTTQPLDDKWAELYVIIGSSLYDSLVDLNVLSQCCAVLHPGIDFETIQFFLSFHEQLGSVDPVKLPLLVPQIVTYLSRIHYLDKMNQHSSDETNILELATAYMKDNLEKRLAVEDVALYVNMGYEKFRKLFTTRYGISPGNYMIRNRIYKAQKMLSNTELSVKEVSIQLGYVDTYTFSKQFKKITGRTPSDFKRLFFM